MVADGVLTMWSKKIPICLRIMAQADLNSETVSISKQCLIFWVATLQRAVRTRDSDSKDEWGIK